MNTDLLKNIHNESNKIIIKRKKDIIDFKIKAGRIIKSEESIYVDSEILKIDKKVFKISELKSMYILSTKYKNANIVTLEIDTYNIFNRYSIDITEISDEDVDKLNELFEYFIFSNEQDREKLTSYMYFPLIENVENTIDIKGIKHYSEKDIITRRNYKITLNDDYTLYKVFPKKYFKERFKNKNEIVYESMFANKNYVDIWVKRQEYDINKKMS